jgi:hypothetical protein
VDPSTSWIPAVGILFAFYYSGGGLGKQDGHCPAEAEVLMDKNSSDIFILLARWASVPAGHTDPVLML